MSRFVFLIIVVMALVPCQQVFAQASRWTCDYCQQTMSKGAKESHSCPQMREAMRRLSQQKTKPTPVQEKEDASGSHTIVITYDASTAKVVIDSVPCQFTNNSCRLKDLKKGEYVIELVNKKKKEESPYILNQRADDIYKEAESLKKNGKKEEASRKYKDALELYKKAAEKENRDAQYSLAYQYQYGYGTEKDEAEALKWYTESANNGRASAQRKMGEFYLKGTMGLPVDSIKATEWLRKAAANYTNNVNIKKKDQERAKETYKTLVDAVPKAQDNGKSKEYIDSIVNDLVNSSWNAIIDDDLETASDLLDKGMKLQSDNPYIISYRGLVLILVAEYKKAVDYYDKYKLQHKSRLLSDLELCEKEFHGKKDDDKRWEQLEELKKRVLR